MQPSHRLLTFWFVFSAGQAPRVDFIFAARCWRAVEITHNTKVISQTMFLCTGSLAAFRTKAKSNQCDFYCEVEKENSTCQNTVSHPFKSPWQSIKRMKWMSKMTHFVEVTLLLLRGDKAVRRMKCLKDPWTQDSFSLTNTTNQSPPRSLRHN